MRINLVGLTSLYLFIPAAIFILGMIQPFLAIPLVGLAGWLLFKTISNQSLDQRTPISKVQFLIVTGLAFVWTGLAHAPQLNPGNLALMKSQSLLADLVIRSWPVSFLSDGGLRPLQFPVGFYLPAAIAGKWLGWKAALVIYFLFAWAGVTLSLLWFSILVGSKSIWAAVVFVFFGGMDVLGMGLFSGRIGGGTGFIEGWSWFWQYSSNTTALFWSPQFAISAWLCASVIIYLGSAQKSASGLAFLMAICAFWSPLVLIGLLPLVFVSYKKSWPFGLPVYLEAGGALLLAFIGFLFGFPQDQFIGWMTHLVNFHWAWPRLLFFYILEIGILVLVAPSSNLTKEIKPFWKPAIIALFLIPLYSIGTSGEFALYASLPALFVLWIGVAQNLLKNKNTLGRQILCLVVFLGSFAALSEISRALIAPKFGFPSLEKVGSRLRYTDKNYLGDANSFFFRRLSKYPSLTDFYRISSSQDSRTLLIIEAESHENETRVDHVQENTLIPGSKLIDNGFGSESGDQLVYTFWLNEDVQNAVVLISYATMLENAALEITVDKNHGEVVGAPQTGEWWNFMPAEVEMGPLSRGRHVLHLQTNGVNVNIDYLAIKEAAAGRGILIEAEAYENTARRDFIQKSGTVHGGQMIANEFGARPHDKLKYTFELKDSVRQGYIAVSYATLQNNPDVEILIDNQSLGRLKCINTESWILFVESTLPMGPLAAGRHELVIESHGENINLDYVLIQPLEMEENR